MCNPVRKRPQTPKTISNSPLNCSSEYLKGINSNYNWQWDRDMNGGILGQYGCQIIDALEQTMRQPVIQVQSLQLDNLCTEYHPSQKRLDNFLTLKFDGFYKKSKMNRSRSIKNSRRNVSPTRRNRNAEEPESDSDSDNPNCNHADSDSGCSDDLNTAGIQDDQTIRNIEASRGINNNWRRITADDFANCQLKFEDGTLGILNLNGADPVPGKFKLDIEFYCDNGHLKISDFKTVITRKFTAPQSEVICDDLKSMPEELLAYIDQVEPGAPGMDKIMQDISKMSVNQAEETHPEPVEDEEPSEKNTHETSTHENEKSKNLEDEKKSEITTSSSVGSPSAQTKTKSGRFRSPERQKRLAEKRQEEQELRKNIAFENTDDTISKTPKLMKLALLCFSKKIEKEIRIRMELDDKARKQSEDGLELTSEEQALEQQREMEAYHEIPLATFEDSLRSQAILDALRKSNDTSNLGLSNWNSVDLDEYYF